MTTIKNRRLRPRAHRFALESRQLFDGAALAETAIHEASASDLVHHESATEPAKALDIPHAATADAASEKPGSAASEVYVIDQAYLRLAVAGGPGAAGQPGGDYR